MKKFLFVVMGLTFIAGCDKSDFNVHCGKHDVKIVLGASGDTIRAYLYDTEIPMDIAPSASGARYIGEYNGAKITLWNKGRNWTLFLNDDKPIECK